VAIRPGYSDLGKDNRKGWRGITLWTFCGFWHGANWTFLAWGAYHALLFLPLILMGKNRRYRDTVAEGRWLPSLKETGQMLLTFFLVVIGWIIFRAETIGQAWVICKRVLSPSILSIPDMSGITGFTIAICIMLVVEWIQRDKPHPLDLRIPWWPVRAMAYFSIFFLILALGGHSENFIYFQF